MKKFNLILIALMSIALINTNAQTPSLKVTSTGNVGIGTDTPDDKLEVVGNVSSEGITVTKTGGSGTAVFERTGKAAMIIGSGAQAGFTFDEDYRFQIQTNTRSEVLGRKLSSGANIMVINGANRNTGFGVYSPTEKVHVNGNVFATSYLTPSDSRLKKDIVDFKDGLNIINQLRPIKYQYNGKAGLETKKDHIGIFAQDLQKAAPYLVEEFVHEETNEKGELLKQETYLKIHDSEIKYLLINAIQEQQANIESQRAIIEQLEEELELVKDALKIKSGKNDNNQLLEINGAGTEKAYLGQNAPNPFEGEAIIEYFLPEETSNANIVVFDNTGKIIKELELEEKGAGTIDLKMNEMPSGIYHYSLIINGKTMDSKQMILK